MSRYEEPQEGEWVQPIRTGYKFACCDCGLVHKMDFRVRRGHAQLRVFRDNRATAQVRRHANIAVEQFDLAKQFKCPDCKFVYRGSRKACPKCGRPMPTVLAGPAFRP